MEMSLIQGEQLRSANPMPLPAIQEALTSREIEVLRLLADGLTTKQVATHLGIAFKTAACHRYRIMQKLYVGSTVMAVRCAIRQGILKA